MDQLDNSIAEKFESQKQYNKQKRIHDLMSKVNQLNDQITLLALKRDN